MQQTLVAGEQVLAGALLELGAADPESLQLTLIAPRGSTETGALRGPRQTRSGSQRTNADKGLGLTIIDAVATARNATFTVAAQTPPHGGLRNEVNFPAPP